jgi:hypothetical protein
MSNDMNDSSYVPTNNQAPVEETPLATADQFPHPPTLMDSPIMDDDEAGHSVTSQPGNRIGANIAQSPLPPGHFAGRDDEDFHGIDPDPFDGEFGNMEGHPENDRDGVDYDDVEDQEEQDAILEALIEEDRIAKEAEEAERMAFIGLDPAIPAAVNDLAYHQEYPTAEEVQTEAPADPTGLLPHVTPDDDAGYAHSDPIPEAAHPAPKPDSKAAKKSSK